MTSQKTISAAAREIGVAAETLREYERRGIVSPRRDSSGRRLFSASDVQAVRSYRESRSKSQGAVSKVNASDG